MKQEAFSRAYVKSKFNGTKAAKETYNPINDNSAALIASENIRKPQVKQRINELLDQIIPEDKALNILNRNLTQDKNIPASNQALDMHFKLKGAYAPEKKINLNANLTPEQIESRLKELDNELERINGSPESNK